MSQPQAEQSTDLLLIRLAVAQQGLAAIEALATAARDAGLPIAGKIETHTETLDEILDHLYEIASMPRCIFCGETDTEKLVLTKRGEAAICDDCIHGLHRGRLLKQHAEPATSPDAFVGS